MIKKISNFKQQIKKKEYMLKQLSFKVKHKQNRSCKYEKFLLDKLLSIIFNFNNLISYCIGCVESQVSRLSNS